MKNAKYFKYELKNQELYFFKFCADNIGEKSDIIFKIIEEDSQKFLKPEFIFAVKKYSIQASERI